MGGAFILIFLRVLVFLSGSVRGCVIGSSLGGVSGNYITKVKPVTATFTLAGKGGDGYRPAGMKK